MWISVSNKTHFLTEAHSSAPLHQCQRDDQPQRAMTRDSENSKDKNQGDDRLSNQDQKLGENGRYQYFREEHPGNHRPEKEQDREKLT
jgi:hypothetical protein